MLELPGKSFRHRDELMSDAVKQLKNQRPEWSDLSVHDPGMTLLELLAHLQMEQQKKINTLTDDYRQAYLDLLNFPRQAARCAETDLLINTNLGKRVFPNRCKFKAQNISFETDKRLIINNNKLRVIVTETKQETTVFNKELEIERNRVWDLFGNNPQVGDQVYFGLMNPLAANTDVYLLWQLTNCSSIARNHIIDDKEYIPLVQLAWEYYGCFNDTVGWHNINVMEDKTYNWLFSGRMIFQITGQHLPYTLQANSAQVFPIRCRLVQGEYDVIPQLQQAYINCVPLLQRDTLCHSYDFTSEQLQQNWFEVDTWLACYGYMQLYYYNGNGWMLAKENIDYKQEINYKKNKRRINWFAVDRPPLKAVFWEHEDLVMRFTFDCFGWINQTIELELKHILPEELKIMIGEEQADGSMCWQDWQQVKSLKELAPTDNCYQLDAERALLKFGDNRNGKVPTNNVGKILVTDCAITKAADGNILGSRINQIVDKQTNSFSDVDIQQLRPATGGRAWESLSDAEIRLVQDRKTEYRAITMEDYEQIVRATPGLMISYVKALPLYKPGIVDYPNKKADNCVTLIVEANHYKFRSKLSDGYKQNILQQLEKYRLITTQIYIIEPKYIGLEISGEIVVKDSESLAKVEIANAYDKYIVDIEHQVYNTIRLNYGDIYGMIDLLPQVSHIRYLNIDTVGSRTGKTRAGDILIPADSRFFIKKLDLSLVAHKE